MNGEDDLVARIARQWAGGSAPAGTLGIGDDAAVIPRSGSAPLLISTDLFVEDVHFKTSSSPPAFIGLKALAVATSDIGAMGGTPTGCLLSLGIPKRAGRRVVDPLLGGFHEEARRLGIPLLGGDLSRSSKGIVVDVVVLGRVCGRRPILRSGARPGNGLYVTGPLGGAAAGLRRLRAGTDVRRLLRAHPRGHLRPHPPLAAGAAFGRSGLPTAMMDLSDGLAVDLHRLAKASGVGARVDEEALPRHEAAVHVLGQAGALRAALGGGEDYELLLTAPPGAEGRLRRLARRAHSGLFRIGEVTTRGRGVLLAGPGGAVRPLPRLGHDHLARTPSPRRRGR
jgi:thiamine-monophosphate kinase